MSLKKGSAYRRGFFGGTFDPIHFGHLNLAIQLLEKGLVDEILFCPANISPTKLDSPSAISNENRFEMTKRAIEGIDRISLCDLETKRSGASYTIDTILELKEKHPLDEFFLILGEDLLLGLDQWKEIEKLLLLSPPLVGARKGAVPSNLPPPIKEKIEKGIQKDFSQMDISSTQVRSRLKKGLYCDHLVPAKVLDYIHENKLYT